MPIVRHLIDAAKGKHPVSAARSTHWPKVRSDHLQLHPVCEVCGGSENLEVHHIRPFHLHPDLELDPKNLITLCEAKKDGVNCHLFIGHLGSFKSFNTTVRADASQWSEKIKRRPLSDS
ncbi:HNH endonuclease [Paraburkholderia unamae]|uniref:HNH endonuclease n=1 Tax=Paraburkholderia unamae TaxID=219649 RepID=A0ABX5K6Q2_9BURK|nr:HNH endonuclease [Paraburkholderia unamae]PVX61216.1 HNH endonuclease [Paraburkholderia unamae]